MSLYRIMLVDDEEEVRGAMIRQMDWEKLGFTVVGDAENGQDALEKLEQLEPDVIMTDIRMPYMDGLSLVARIREKYPFTARSRIWRRWVLQIIGISMCSVTAIPLGII